MSDMQDPSAFKAEETLAQGNRFDPAAAFPSQGDKVEAISNVEKSLDGQSYFLGEVPQTFLYDPQAFLPLNSDKLIGSVDMIERLSLEVNTLIQDEVAQIQRLQKKINLWEERIEKNKAHVHKNEGQVKQNLVDIGYDKKNRDYWFSRAEQVTLDYDHASASGRSADWAWLVKKYGFKNPDGSPVDYKNLSIEEICEGSAQNLASEYKIAGNRYELAKKDKETQNNRMIQENGRLLNANEELQGFIATAYTQEIEPLQDGVLLMKELGVKLKSLSADKERATYGELRSWSEPFLDEFLRSNPRVDAQIVTEFRRITSTPLPAKYS